MDSETDIAVSVELTGDYDEVVSILGGNDAIMDGLIPVMEDLEDILEALARSGGGTRSVIAEETSVEISPTEIASLFAFLESYDLVELDGNTWYPGPKLDT